MTQDVKAIAYEELCAPVLPQGLLDADDDAIATLATAEAQQAIVPVDLAGLVENGATAAAGAGRSSARADSWWTAPFEVPALYGVVLRDTLCIGGRIRQISGGVHSGGNLLLAHEHLVVPDSYHVRDRNRTLADCLEPVPDAPELVGSDQSGTGTEEGVVDDLAGAAAIGDHAGD